MRSLKSTSTSAAATTTLKTKRKLAQTKEYPESPPATPNAKQARGKKRVSDVNSPPPKRRRSSDRIANSKKRQSMEDDDGFVFKRAQKPKRNPVEVRSAKPFVMDFTADVRPIWILT
jgi:hypothetical protein